MTPAHQRQLLRIALAIPLSVLVIFAGFLVASSSLHWDVVETARRAALCLMIVLALCIVAPLFVAAPSDDRRRGFIVFWFAVSAFFNVAWQIPLIAFRETITNANRTHENLWKFIAWWGYGSADSHYGRVTGWMKAEELWWFLAILLSIVGLVMLRRGRDLHGYLWLGIAGALEAYNASLYMVHDYFVGRYANVANDSAISMLLYWGFNPLWTLAALAASIFSFRFVVDALDDLVAARAARDVPPSAPSMGEGPTSF